MEQIIGIEARLRDECSALDFSFPGYIYNPLEYAWEMHCRYQQLAVRKECHVLFLGMNPGPFGMAQTGVPFGCVSSCRDYLGLEGPVGRPSKEHPARPVLGFECRREEVSGKRFWSLIESCYPCKDDFFSFATVQNYCPLIFIDGGRSGRNITPDKLRRSERLALEEVCMKALADTLDALSIDAAVGIGAYASERLRQSGRKMKIITVPHPSPANPASAHDWQGRCRTMLEEEGIF